MGHRKTSRLERKAAVVRQALCASREQVRTRATGALRVIRGLGPRLLPILRIGGVPAAVAISLAIVYMAPDSQILLWIPFGVAVVGPCYLVFHFVNSFLTSFSRVGRPLATLQVAILLAGGLTIPPIFYAFGFLAAHGLGGQAIHAMQGFAYPVTTCPASFGECWYLSFLTMATIGYDKIQAPGALNKVLVVFEVVTFWALLAALTSILQKYLERQPADHNGTVNGDRAG